MGLPRLPCGSDGKESTCNAGGMSLIFGLGTSPVEGSGNLLQYSCLGKSRTEKTGKPKTKRSQKVRHDCATKQHQKSSLKSLKIIY